MDNKLKEKLEAEPVSSNEIYKFLTAHWHHHNQLSWSKLYVLLAVESATLAAGFQLHSDTPNVACALVLVGTVVGIILYRLMQRDWEIRDDYTTKLDLAHSSLGIRMIPSSSGPSSHGQSLLLLLVILLVAVNASAAWLWKCAPWLLGG
jgi:hypothetical protein